MNASINRSFTALGVVSALTIPSVFTQYASADTITAYTINFDDMLPNQDPYVEEFTTTSTPGVGFGVLRRDFPGSGYGAMTQGPSDTMVIGLTTSESTFGVSKLDLTSAFDIVIPGSPVAVQITGVKENNTTLTELFFSETLDSNQVATVNFGGAWNSGLVALKIDNLAGDITPYVVDNVSLVNIDPGITVPEPSSGAAALMGLGALALVSGRRRREPVSQPTETQAHSI